MTSAMTLSVLVAVVLIAVTSHVAVARPSDDDPLTLLSGRPRWSELYSDVVKPGRNPTSGRLTQQDVDYMREVGVLPLR
jgi:hypothetical protein